MLINSLFNPGSSKINKNCDVHNLEKDRRGRSGIDVQAFTYYLEQTFIVFIQTLKRTN